MALSLTADSMRDQVKVLLAGGGTGGHIYPALAVAQGIQQRFRLSEVLFLGTHRGVEKDAVPAAGFRIEFVHARGLSKQPVKAAMAVVETGAGFVQAMAVLHTWAPHVVIGSGGYVSAPVVAAAGCLGIPVVLLEQNVEPGKTTRLLSRYARRICVSFEDSLPYLPEGRAIVTGNPVRADILARTREDGRRRLDLPADEFCLLVTGASQGARSINEAILQALPLWKDQALTVLHLTGKAHHADIQARAQGLVNGGRMTYRPIAYLEDMASAYAAADLVVARAGATTLAEVTSRGLPGVYVPYPFAADNHQEKNARRLEARGAALVLPDREVGDRLAACVLELCKDAPRLQNMSASSLALGRPKALDAILDVIEQVVATPRKR
ncbi:MAG TPA: undecaprenyldiphospho-muramoylpentapeptide beta-N-acetylglucosaminyltransferase [Candidatus Xenobia bacterium]|jgi:UDP-N-acetylglucosamine--N-acetylmuramyl-(pentapeptide) pyrophosphoryl-undecaprenol N-acetylglucosamine transferase